MKRRNSETTNLFLIVSFTPDLGHQYPFSGFSALLFLLVTQVTKAKSEPSVLLIPEIY